MMPILLSAVLAMLLPTAAVSQKSAETANLQVTQCALRVKGMSCDGCAGLVEKGLLKLDGVKSAKVDFKTASVQVEYDAKKTTPEKVVAAFNQANPGFRTEQLKPSRK